VYTPQEPFPTLVLIVGILIFGTLAKDLALMGNMILVERLAQLTTFDFRKLFNFFGILGVMRNGMMGIRHADFWIGSIAGFAGQLERDDSSQIRLQREGLQVKHQLGMIGEGAFALIYISTLFVLGLVILFSLLGLLLILYWPGRNRSPYTRRTVSNRNGTGWRPLD